MTPGITSEPLPTTVHPTDVPATADNDWAAAQKRTFTNWVNAKLVAATAATGASYATPVSELSTDLQDGRKLLALVAVLSAKTIAASATPCDLAPERQCSLRIHHISNVGKALRYIETASGEPLLNIGPEDIVDGSPKLTLGLIWQLILRFQLASLAAVEPVSSFSADAPEDSAASGTAASTKLLAKSGSLRKKARGTNSAAATLQKVQRSTLTYVAVKISENEEYVRIMEPQGPPKTLGAAWSDGRAFCCLVHSLSPEFLSLSQVHHPVQTDKEAKENLELAFRVAAEHLAIPALLCSDDVIHFPDDKSILTYLSSFVASDEKATKSFKTLVDSPVAAESKVEPTDVARASSSLGSIGIESRALSGPTVTKEPVAEEKSVAKTATEASPEDKPAENSSEPAAAREIIASPPQTIQEVKREVKQDAEASIVSRAPEQPALRQRTTANTQTSTDNISETKAEKGTKDLGTRHKIFELERTTRKLLVETTQISVRTMTPILVRNAIDCARKRLVDLDMQLRNLVIDSPSPKAGSDGHAEITEAFARTSSNLHAVSAILDSQAHAALTNRCLTGLWIIMAVAMLLFTIRRLVLWRAESNVPSDALGSGGEKINVTT